MKWVKNQLTCGQYTCSLWFLLQYVNAQHRKPGAVDFGDKYMCFLSINHKNLGQNLIILFRERCDQIKSSCKYVVPFMDPTQSSRCQGLTNIGFGSSFKFISLHALHFTSKIPHENSVIQFTENASSLILTYCSPFQELRPSSCGSHPCLALLPRFHYRRGEKRKS